MSVQMEVAENIFSIQGDDGNWNYSEYMFGMYNGMALMMSIFRNEGKDPEYRDTPDEWLCDVK
jgi:hypothetical protein